MLRAQKLLSCKPQKRPAPERGSRCGASRKSDRKNQQGQQVNATITRAISLTVPGKTPKDAVQYKTTLTWLLSDVPVNNGGK